MTASSPQRRYDTARPTYVRVNEHKFADLEAGTTVLIASPSDIEAEIDRVPPGELLTQRDLRQRLSQRHGTDGACPVMTSMNLRIVAEVALGAIDAGVPAEDVTPVWVVIDPGSPLASKLPGGPSRIERLRRPTPV